MTWFCDCFRKWKEEGGAWPKWVLVESAASATGALYVVCDFHGGKWLK